MSFYFNNLVFNILVFFMGEGVLYKLMVFRRVSPKQVIDRYGHCGQNNILFNESS